MTGCPTNRAYFVAPLSLLACVAVLRLTRAIDKTRRPVDSKTSAAWRKSRAWQSRAEPGRAWQSLAVCRRNDY